MIIQATLCASLGASDTVANLPTSAYFWSAIVPVVVAARFHTLAATNPVLVAAYALMAAAGALVVAALWWPLPVVIRLAVIVVYGGMVGVGLGVRNVFLWEVVNRGISHQRRAWAYSLSFGLGPFFAVVGSLGAQLLLAGQVELPWPSLAEGFTLTRLQIVPLEFPLNFLALFGATVPVLGVASFLASQFVLPKQGQEAPQMPLFVGVRQGVRELRRDRILLFALLAYVLVDAGGTITSNMSLYTAEVLKISAERFAGYQNALRFSCKMTVGLLLGWLVIRTHAKMGMLITGTLCLSGIVWALSVSNTWFLFCFGLMGAGELYGVYYLNYAMARSHPDRLRQNMAMLQLLSLATGIAPATFGALADVFNLPISFVAAGAAVCGSLALIIFCLPAVATPPVESASHLTV